MLKLKNFFSFLIIISLSFLASSCRFTRPLTSVILNKKTIMKDYTPDRIKVYTEFNYFNTRRIPFFGVYTNVRIIEIKNGNVVERTNTRIIKGFIPEIPYYKSIKHTIFDSEGKKVFVSKYAVKWGVNTLVDRNIYFKNGKRVRKENCLKIERSTKK